MGACRGGIVIDIALRSTRRNIVFERAIFITMESGSAVYVRVVGADSRSPKDEIRCSKDRTAGKAESSQPRF
jgi:hypothetical protein